MAFLTEADTCRRYVLPKLYAADWIDEPTSSTAFMFGFSSEFYKRSIQLVYGYHYEQTTHLVPGPLRANISETLPVVVINEQGEEEKNKDEQEFSWCCLRGRGWRGTKRRRA